MICPSIDLINKELKVMSGICSKHFLWNTSQLSAISASMLYLQSQGGSKGYDNYWSDYSQGRGYMAGSGIPELMSLSLSLRLEWDPFFPGNTNHVYNTCTHIKPQIMYIQLILIEQTGCPHDPSLIQLMLPERETFACLLPSCYWQVPQNSSLEQFCLDQVIL